MILSVSRRTDIPSYYSEWFFNRVKEGFVYIKNPIKTEQISKININPDIIDGIVFWSKNPKPMINRLDEIKKYKYYFQFTITSYDNDIEKNLPPKDEIIQTFIELSDIIGPERIIWRYDPILLNYKYDFGYHIIEFEKIANLLKGKTNKVTISFIDEYTKIKSKIKDLKLFILTKEIIRKFCISLAKIAQNNNLIIDTCAEIMDLEDIGISHACCIDGELFKQLGCNLDAKKDKNQRSECRCIESIDIGIYNTCMNGCCYCYANYYNLETLISNYKNHDPKSPIIYGSVDINKDKITERKIKSLQIKDPQLLKSFL
jgi:hypothetical protein